MTDTVGISSLAEIVHWNTNPLRISIPSLRTLKTDLVVPVPSSTSQVRRPSRVQGIKDTDIVGSQNEAPVASSTHSSLSVGGTVVVDGGTESTGVEDESLGALKTDLVVPVPIGTSQVGWATLVDE